LTRGKIPSDLVLKGSFFIAYELYIGEGRFIAYCDNSDER
jgi:hypothetical protein